MKCLLSWVTAGLAALLQLQCLAGALSLKRNQPEASVIKELRDALDARTEDVTQQKNIAHGLELEVRELQSDLQAEKKALGSESQKEQALQQKLNRVRVVLDDAPASKRNDESGGKGSSASVADPSAVPAVSTMLAPVSDDVAVMKTGTHNAQLVQPLEVSPNAAPPETVEAVHAGSVESPPNPSASDSGLESPVGPPQHQQAPPALQKSTPVVHSRQIAAQEPPPFSEAAPIQPPSESRSSPATPGAKLMTDLDSAMNAFARKPSEDPNEKAAGGVREMAAKTKHAPKAKLPQSAHKPSKARHSSRSPLLRGAKPISKAIATPAIAKTVPAAPAALPPSIPQRLSDANVVASGVKDSGAAPSPTSDFDALEEQLHEEDRRIQDLDNENDLDAMTEGGRPAAPGSSQPPAKKAAAAQPKMEMDSNAPVEDFLNAEAPGPDVSEAVTAMS